MNSSPLVVLNALTVRADSSPPEDLRAARPRYNANRRGEGSEDPGVLDRRLALCEQPQLEWEAYDEYWRKTHGPKFVFEEGSPDPQTPLLQYYLQQHRVPAGPSSEQPPPYRAKTDEHGRLQHDPAAHCEPYRRPAWDGLAQLAYRTKQDLETAFDAGPGKYGEKIMPDEAVFLRGFGFHVAEEHVVLQNGDRRRDPLLLIKTHARNGALTRPQFRGRWMAQHAALIGALPQARGLIRRYVQLVNVSVPTDRVYDPVGDRYDGVTVMSFANTNDLEDFLVSPEYARVAADEAEFAADTRYFSALNYVIRDVT